MNNHIWFWLGVIIGALSSGLMWYGIFGGWLR